jgi:hypothetical protein
VTDVGQSAATVEFVNLADDRRRVLVQAGAFGEHRFRSATYRADRQRVRSEFTNRTVEVVLAGRSEATVDLGMERFVEEPRYAFPWDR